jgi:hypothetical protein
MTICYKFSTRSRPDKLFSCLENIHSLSKHDDYYILLTLDVDDNTVTTSEVRDKIATYPKVIPYWGISQGSKIVAINRDLYFAPSWDILINMSDDFVFLKPGFDVQIIQDITNYFSDLDGFVHYPDGAVNSKLATMSIMGRKYFDRFGYIYHPDYESVYCDQEAMEVAKKLGKYKFINNQLFEHRHPRWKKAEWDEQYRKTEDAKVYAKDRETFMRRKANNFYL